MLAKHINDGTSYNVNIAEATVSETGFTDKQFEQLAALLAPIKQDIVEIKDRLSNLEKDVAQLKQDVAKIMSLPTIQRELKLQKSS